MDGLFALCVRADAISNYPQLHFFNIAEKERADGSSGLLSVVIGSIFDSPSIKHSIKLPLAIRYDNVMAVENIMSRQGSKLLKTNEMAVDSRLAMFAAFHDQADVFAILKVRFAHFLRCGLVTFLANVPWFS